MSSIWVYAEASDGQVASITLEMLVKARELGTVECIYGGGDADAIAAGVREYADVGVTDFAAAIPPSAPTAEATMELLGELATNSSG